jgi:alpha-1,2-mannosyltransferase
MMLLLSPFGWLYYFPILTLPLAITWSRARQAGFASATVWVLCLFFLNFPMDYIPANKMQSLLAILSFHSFHFYGLLLLLYLTKQTKTVTHATTEIITDFTPIFVIIFSFVLAVMMISFWMRLS